jgi:hypothetical protein
MAADLDLTLVRINTFPFFVRFLFRQLLLEGRWVMAARLCAELALRKGLGTSHVRLKRTVSALGGRVDPMAIRQWASDLVSQYANEEALGLAHAFEGTRALVTSAPEVYASHIASLCEFHIVQGSRFVNEDFIENSGTAKVVSLAGIASLPVAIAVTDDDSLDGPLLENAATGYLIVSPVGGLGPSSVVKHHGDDVDESSRLVRNDG